jgi:hypothetical protein
MSLFIQQNPLELTGELRKRSSLGSLTTDFLGFLSTLATHEGKLPMRRATSVKGNLDFLTSSRIIRARTAVAALLREPLRS